MMKLPVEIITENSEMTEIVGADLAKAIAEDSGLPRFIAMYGDLGVGKTAFVRGFCSYLCPGAIVKSPTFALVNEHKVTNVTSGMKKVCHFDMYRIADEDDLYSIGFYDYLKPDSVCIAEWCEMIPYALPDSYIKIEIEKLDFENKRKIHISSIGV